LLKNDCNVLFLGNTGVGKSVIVHDYLMNSDKDSYIYTGINFSAQTSTHNLYDIFEEKLTARKRTLLGPPIGKKMIIFVDDVNMP